MNYFIVFYILFFLLVNSNAQYSSVISNANAKVRMDGRLSENIYNQLISFTPFCNHFPMDSRQDEHQTEVKIFYNGRFQFIGAVCHDSEPRNNYRRLDF
ncbi:MAG: hypothetical protein AAGA77_08355 [Bacteroidota bacterium]